MLVAGSFSAARLPTDFSFDKLTLANYAAVYGDPRTYRVMSNTLAYVVGSVGIGLSLALAFAWLVARTDLPLKWIAWAGIPLAIVMPGMLESMVWVLLFSPRIGFVNRFAQGALGFGSAPFDVYSLLGMIALESIRLVPTAFLLIVPLLLRFDPTLEEAAMMSGARLRSIIRGITVPLLLPGLIAIVVYESVSVLSDFEVPGIIGLPGQIYVFSTLIYTYTSAAASSGGSDFGAASALAMVYLVVNVVGIWLYARATRTESRFAVITGKAYRPRTRSLGWWRWPALAAIAAYLGIAIGLPVLTLLWASLTPRILQPGVDALARITPANWQRLVANDDLLQSVGNTVIVVVATASLTVVVALAIAWVVTRTRFRARRLLDQLAFITHGIPGVIMALALIWLWIRLDAIPIYGTLWIIVLGFVIGFLAYGTRAAGSALLQVHAELEEASATSGATTLVTLRRIFVPLLLPALAGLWIWVALHAVRFVSLPLMLQSGQDNTVLSVFLWRQWEAGEVNLVAAAGLALIGVMLVITLTIARYAVGGRRASLSS